MAPAIGLLIYYAGVLTENARQNWFMGVRTPWTLSSEKVWNKTNRLALEGSSRLPESSRCWVWPSPSWP